MSPKIRNCCIYARISLATEDSVSIERQIESGRAYAALRGWNVVGVFVDEGISATHNRPDVRKGWRALMASAASYDAVVVWKVDRLARRVIDFLTANDALQTRGAGLVAVEDPIDMTTAQGRAFATMLAVFAELEAAGISARVTGARDHLLRNGRHAGGALPYGYRTARNPNGAGYIVVQDPDAIDHVREMVRRTLAGYSVYSTMQWLNEVGAPTVSVLRDRRRSERVAAGEDPKPITVNPVWAYNTVDKIIRHPLLAGMTPHNPGRPHTTRERGEGLVRDTDGLPVVDESLAIITQGEYRTLLASLAEQNKPQRVPKALRATPSNLLGRHSGVLSGLVWCASDRHPEPLRMHRGTTGNAATVLRPAYSCPACHQSLTNAEDLIIATVLAKRGAAMNMRMVEEVVEGGSVQMQEASIRLAELGRELIAATPERAAEIFAEMGRLKAIQEEARARPTEVRWVPIGGEDRTIAEDWAAASTDEERRDIIGHALDRVFVRPGRTGARSDAAKLARMTFEWMPYGDIDDPPSNEELAEWATEALA